MRPEDVVGFMHTKGGNLIQAFSFIRNGKTHLIVEPHPVVLYFNGAQNYLKHIEESKFEVFLEVEKPMQEGDVYKELDALYTFFSNMTIFVNFLYNSIEAFVNYKIPDKYEYKRVTKRNTELYNKQQIQRQFALEQKLKEVLPNIFGKSFVNQHAHKYDVILKLKACRDEIIHTKDYSGPHLTEYRVLFTHALNFDYTSAINAVSDFINFYEPGLIEICGCSAGH